MVMRRGRGEKKGLNETNDDYGMVNTLAEAEPAVTDGAGLSVPDSPRRVTSKGNKVTGTRP